MQLEFYVQSELYARSSNYELWRSRAACTSPYMDARSCIRAQKLFVRYLSFRRWFVL